VQPTPGPVSVPIQRPTGPDKTPWRHVTLRDLIASGSVRLPLDIETTYKGQQLTARIEADGNVKWNGGTPCPGSRGSTGRRQDLIAQDYRCATGRARQTSR
jgi:hypothetical protein